MDYTQDINMTIAVNNEVSMTITNVGGPQGDKGDKGDTGDTGTTDFNALENKPTLGTAAATDATDYATAAQGIKADTAVQPATLEAGLATKQPTGDYATNTALALKSNITDIVDNLASISTNTPLSANQGRVLKGLIDTINTILTSDDTTLDELQEIVEYIKLNREELDALSIASIAGLQTALNGKQATGDYATNSAVTDGLATKQDTLVSGTNIKTINGSTVLGAGNLAIESGNPYIVGAGASSVHNQKPTIYDNFDTGWTNLWSNGTTSTDATNPIEGTSSLKLTTNTATALYQFVGKIKTVSLDLSKSAFSVWVKADNWSNVLTTDLIFSSSGSSFTDFFYIQINGETDSGNNINPPDNEWIELSISKSGAVVADGNPNWAAIDRIGVRASAKVGASANVNLSGFKVFPAASSGVVSFTFDDGYNTDYTTAKPILDKYGYKATSFIVSGSVGANGRLTETQINSLHKSGWDISGHTDTHPRLTSITQTQRIAELKASKKWLTERGYRGADVMAYPNSITSSAVKSDVQQYFSFARTASGLGQPRTYVIPHSIHALDIWENTDLAYVQSWIDKAVANGDWLVFLFHGIRASPSSSIDISTALFTSIVDAVNTSGLAVRTMSEELSMGAIDPDDILPDPNGVKFINHGSNASAARPKGAGMVIWTGTVSPLNAVTTVDLWNDVT